MYLILISKISSTALCAYSESKALLLPASSMLNGDRRTIAVHVKVNLEGSRGLTQEPDVQESRIAVRIASLSHLTARVLVAAVAGVVGRRFPSSCLSLFPRGIARSVLPLARGPPHSGRLPRSPVPGRFIS